MIESLETVKQLNRKADEVEVQETMLALGETPSIATLEEVLKRYKAKRTRILAKDLLEWMQENDQTSFENEDLKVSIKTYVSAKILNPELAFPWLEANQYGDLIKDTLEFPKGEFNQDAEKALEELGLSYTKKSGIHPQTLKKILSDRILSGDVLPEGSEEDPGDGIEVSYHDECVVKEK